MSREAVIHRLHPTAAAAGGGGRGSLKRLEGGRLPRERRLYRYSVLLVYR